MSISHCNAAAIKTDAPHEVIWDILRCWVSAITLNMNVLCVCDMPVTDKFTVPVVIQPGHTTWGSYDL